jgi:anti-sigma regulatory factor (Ser/Thr protein kinase)
MTERSATSSAETVTYRANADGNVVVGLREALREWLDSSVDISAERVCDIVLATDEALANVSEHAYRDFPGAGAVTLDLSYDAPAATIEIQVTDQGHWREPAPTPITATRGRGLILMKKLADACTVDGRVDGTSVSLLFYRCHGLTRAQHRLR